VEELAQQMKRSMNQNNRIGITAAGVLIVGLALGGCNTADSKADAKSPDTVAIAPVAAPSSSSPAVSSAVTAVASTEAPTTTAAPTTTEAPAPTTSIPPIPSNVEEVGVMSPPLAAVGGGNGANTAAVQLRLLQLGFWNGGADGKYGKTTQQAVMAFQKYIGLPTSGKVDAGTAAYLSNYNLKAHGLTDTGTLIEIDKGKQLLFIVVDGKTQWVLNTSTATGKEYAEEDKNTPGEIQTGVSITPNGLWKTNRERPEGWWEGDLGQIYRPKYFRGGVAVHGSNSIPDYPASHGCVRLSTQAMDWIWDNNIMPLGTTVWVHE
jgi:lipoprotein-anchoring transpeptidase ErfK/SrfK